MLALLNSDDLIIGIDDISDPDCTYDCPTLKVPRWLANEFYSKTVTTFRLKSGSVNRSQEFQDYKSSPNDEVFIMRDSRKTCNIEILPKDFINLAELLAGDSKLFDELLELNQIEKPEKLTKGRRLKYLIREGKDD